MKNKELIKRILELRDDHIDVFDSDNNINRTCGLASNYFELMNRIADLLKTSKKALDGLQVASDDFDAEVEYNIADVIGIVIKLLPISEMKFVDEVLILMLDIKKIKEKEKH